jgi:hypothetical protein
MKRYLLFFVAALTWAQVPVINSSTIRFDNVGHASLHITYQLTSGSPSEGRIRYTVSPATCTGGTGGTVYTNFRSSGEDSYWRIAYSSGNWYSMPIHGLSANTAYQICPEVTADGANWSTGAGATITTEVLPAVHPALPKPVQRFDTNYPNTTGYTPISVNANDNCTALRNEIRDAIARQLTTGTVISVTAGTACIGKVPIQNVPPDAVQLLPAAFNTSTWIITTPNAVTEGQALTFTATNPEVFGGAYVQAELPGSAVPNGVWLSADGGGFPTPQLPFSQGSVVYAHITCPGCNSTHFQVYAKAPFSAGLCPAGTTSAISENGNIYPARAACPILWQFHWPGSGIILYAPLIADAVGGWTRNLKTIIIRTSTPDSAFVPEHVRLQGPRNAAGDTTPPTQWKSKMAAIQSPMTLLGNLGISNAMFTTSSGGSDPSDLYFAANIRFVGMEITYQPYPQAAVTNDQPPGMPLIVTTMDSSNIIFDRCWIHGYNPPFRTYAALTWNGRNNAIIDSYVNNFNLPRQYNFGLRVH